MKARLKSGEIVDILYYSTESQKLHYYDYYGNFVQGDKSELDPECLPFKVMVKSMEEIEETLDKEGKTKGFTFDKMFMSEYCGKEQVVSKIIVYDSIDIGTYSIDGWNFVKEWLEFFPVVNKNRRVGLKVNSANKLELEEGLDIGRQKRYNVDDLQVGQVFYHHNMGSSADFSKANFYGLVLKNSEENTFIESENIAFVPLGVEKGGYCANDSFRGQLVEGDYECQYEIYDCRYDKVLRSQMEPKQRVGYIKNGVLQRIPQDYYINILEIREAISSVKSFDVFNNKIELEEGLFII